MRPNSLSLVFITPALTAPAAAHGQAPAVTVDQPTAVTESAAALQPGPRRALPLSSAALPAAAMPASPLSGVMAEPETRHGTAQLVVGGLVGGNVGFLVGFALGTAIDDGDESCIDPCVGPAGGLAVLAGEAVGMALGVHVANGRQGNAGKTILASAAILSVGALTAIDSELWLVVPLAQLAGTITMERVGAHR